MLDLFHRGSRFGLFESIFGQGLMSVLQLSNFLLFKINFGHFSMVIGNLFVIIVICWLLVFFQFINRFFLFGLLIFWFSFGCGILVFFALDYCFSLCLDDLSWVLRLNQSVFWWFRRWYYGIIILLLILWLNLTNILNLLFGKVQLLKLLNKVWV